MTQPPWRAYNTSYEIPRPWYSWTQDRKGTTPIHNPTAHARTHLCKCSILCFKSFKSVKFLSTKMLTRQLRMQINIQLTQYRDVLNNRRRFHSHYQHRYQQITGRFGQKSYPIFKTPCFNFQLFSEEEARTPTQTTLSGESGLKGEAEAWRRRKGEVKVVFSHIHTLRWGNWIQDETAKPTIYHTTSCVHTTSLLAHKTNALFKSLTQDQP